MSEAVVRLMHPGNIWWGMYHESTILLPTSSQNLQSLVVACSTSLADDPLLVEGYTPRCNMLYGVPPRGSIDQTADIPGQAPKPGACGLGQVAPIEGWSRPES